MVRGRSPLHAGQISRNHAPHFAKIGRIGRILGDCFFCGCSHTRYLARPCRAGLRVVALASRWRVGGVRNDYYHQLKPARSMYRYICTCTITCIQDPVRMKFPLDFRNVLVFKKRWDGPRGLCSSRKTLKY